MGREAEARLLRRAVRSVAVQTALSVAFVVVIVALGVVIVFDRQQSVEISGIVRRAATTAEDVADPPDGVWLVLVSDSGRTTSAGIPSAAADSTALVSAPSGQVSFTAGGQDWTAWVDQRPDSRFVAVYDPSRHEAEEHRLVMSTTVAGMVGVVLAGVIGLGVGRRAVRPLGRAMRLQRRFVADASHELRTPLAVLHTRAQLLRRQVGRDDPTSADLDQLVADTKALGEVVADLLLSAQLEHADVVGEDVDLSALGAGVVRSLEGYAAQSGVSLTLTAGGRANHHAVLDPGSDRAGDLDGHDDGTWSVIGAPTALRRALLALIDNAVAHSGPGDTVSVEIIRAGDEVRVAVIDTGDGLDPADAARLTERFARGATGRPGGRRFGLGLALVDEVVGAHHGHLQIEGAPGVGSTFIVVLPAGRRPGVDGG